ncbi:hypothetical protein CDN98_11740 [Roseateles terrae]|nr:hypothetical protein CDN98_11740 [Roseateles terrae]
MRESLERVGRFDPVRARERFLNSFVPAQTSSIHLDGAFVGFLVLRREATSEASNAAINEAPNKSPNKSPNKPPNKPSDGPPNGLPSEPPSEPRNNVPTEPSQEAPTWHLEHLYLHPAVQGRGIGGAVLQRLCSQADEAGAAIRLGALKQSDANRFYRRHGFEFTHEGEFDVYYLRPAARG